MYTQMIGSSANVKPFSSAQPLRNYAEDGKIHSKRAAVKQKIREELLSSGRSSHEFARPNNLVLDHTTGALHDKDYLQEMRERSQHSPLLMQRSASLSSSDEEGNAEDGLHRQSFNAIRMPGLPPGVTTAPMNVSVSGHVLNSKMGTANRLDAYAAKQPSQLRLTSGTYASTSKPKQSTLNHSKRNSGNSNSTISERDRLTLSRDYSYRQDPVAIAARQRLSRARVAQKDGSNGSSDKDAKSDTGLENDSITLSHTIPTKPQLSDGQSVRSAGSSVATHRTVPVYNPTSYIPSAAIARHRSAALRAAQQSYSLSSTPSYQSGSRQSNSQRGGSPALPPISDEISSTASSPSLQWNDPINLADLQKQQEEDDDDLKLRYIPSMEHPERHRSSTHQPKLGGIVVPDSVDKGYSKFQRNWEKTKLDVRFAVLRAKRQMKN